ncbi:MAG: cyclic nucleotide-binding domain-containing protein [Deltaproteobacteria bacterium]|nr:cyclic nucleotide-binding domain-containing protein [Deltaproteobacteria bacterium]
MTHDPEALAVLRRAPLLAMLHPRHFEGLVGVMEQGTLQEGQVLFRQGQPGESLAVVSRGLLEVALEAGAGPRTVLGTLGPGDVAGELAVLDPGPRAATVVAREPSQVHCFSRRQLLGLRVKGPGIAMAMVSGILGQVAHRIRRTNGLIEARLHEAHALPASVPAGDDAARAGRLTGAEDLVNPRTVPGEVDLAGVGDLAGLTADDRGELLDLAAQVIYPKGTVLCEEGDWGESCWVLADGRVDVFKNVDGRPRRIGTVDHCLLGQLALVDPAPRAASLRTATDVVALELGRRAWSSLLAQQTGLSVRFQDAVAAACVRQLRRANEHLASLPAPRAARTPIPAAEAVDHALPSTAKVRKVPGPGRPAPAPAALPTPGPPRRVAAAPKGPPRSPREIVEDLLSRSGDAFTQPLERRRPRPATLRLARVQTELLFGVDAETGGRRIP